MEDKDMEKKDGEMKPEDNIQPKDEQNNNITTPEKKPKDNFTPPEDDRVAKLEEQISKLNTALNNLAQSNINGVKDQIENKDNQLPNQTPKKEIVGDNFEDKEPEISKKEVII